MLSAREVVQESTGFSPSELVFGHKVRGPLAVLQDGLKPAEPPVNLIDYVNGFHCRIHLVVKMAGEHLIAVQSIMKWDYDRRAKPQVFCPESRCWRYCLSPLYHSRPGSLDRTQWSNRSLNRTI